MRRPRQRSAARAAWRLALLLGATGFGAAALAAPPPAAVPYPDLLGGVCRDLHRIGAAASPTLEGKELLLQEADRLKLPHEMRELLAERLRNNAFTIAESQMWKPFESFDITLQSRDGEAGALKVKFSKQRYGEYGEQLRSVDPARQDAIRRAALSILAETGQLPEMLPPADGRVRFVYREGCLVTDAPGLMTTYIQGRERELDLATGVLGPAVAQRPETATLSDPALAFTSSGTEAVQLRAAQLEAAFQDPEAFALLHGIHGDVLDLVGDPGRMKARLLELVGLITHAYGIEPVNVEFDTSPAGDGGSGYYFHSRHGYVFHFRRFGQKLDRYVAREKLDLALAADRARAADYMFGELVNNAAHELAHAGQYQWMEKLARDPAAIPASMQARIADYQKNNRYKNTAWESHALIGLLGNADYERYRHQPLEEDAWAIGNHAETLALQLVVPAEPATTLVEASAPASTPTPVAFTPPQ